MLHTWTLCAAVDFGLIKWQESKLLRALKLENEKESRGNIPQHWPGHLISYEVKGQLMKPTTSLSEALRRNSFKVHSSETKPDDLTVDNFSNLAAALRFKEMLIKFFLVGRKYFVRGECVDQMDKNSLSVFDFVMHQAPSLQLRCDLVDYVWNVPPFWEICGSRPSLHSTPLHSTPSNTLPSRSS